MLPIYGEYKSTIVRHCADKLTSIQQPTRYAVGYKEKQTDLYICGYVKVEKQLFSFLILRSQVVYEFKNNVSRANFF